MMQLQGGQRGIAQNCELWDKVVSCPGPAHTFAVYLTRRGTASWLLGMAFPVTFEQFYLETNDIWKAPQRKSY